MLPKAILVATDFSDCARAALAYAVDLAEDAHADVFVLHTYLLPVVGMPALSPAGMATLTASIVRSAEAELEAETGKYGERGIRVEAILRRGDARETIIEVAKDLDVDLVIVGTHGRHGIARALIGSVAESLVRTSPVPVLTVHATDRGAKNAA
jgi:nucleotide-binding universal stress UspA family protein